MLAVQTARTRYHFVTGQVPSIFSLSAPFLSVWYRNIDSFNTDILLRQQSRVYLSDILGSMKMIWLPRQQYNGAQLVTKHLSSCMFKTHWGRVTHICVSKVTIIGSDNGLSPGRRQAIIWTNAGILLIRTSGTNFSEILGEIHSFSFSKMHLKMSSAKWRLFGLGLNELIVFIDRNIEFLSPTTDIVSLPLRSYKLDIFYMPSSL